MVETRWVCSGLKHQKEKRNMDHFAGLDVSVKETSICIVDDTGRIVREVKVASEPEALLQVASFVADMRALNVSPHIAQNISGRRSAIDSRTTRHPGYAVSQQTRKRIEEPFGWGVLLS
jgi:predicted NBD/HSP70 family sugar kinase